MGTKIYFVQNDVRLSGREIIWRRKKGWKKFWIYSNKLEYYYFLMEKQLFVFKNRRKCLNLYCLFPGKCKNEVQIIDAGAYKCYTEVSFKPLALILESEEMK